jgi:hypothetical protein
MVVLSNLSSARDKTVRANALIEMKFLRDVPFLLEIDEEVMLGGWSEDL